VTNERPDSNTSARPTVPWEVAPGTIDYRVLGQREVWVDQSGRIHRLTDRQPGGVDDSPAWTVHRGNGFFSVSNGWEYNFVLSVIGVGIALAGPAGWSLDAHSPPCDPARSGLQEQN
jgi:hypothetical protein